MAEPQDGSYGPIGGGTIYYVKKGDYLALIAARYYGLSSRWRDIAISNNIRDPRYLRVGQRLRLPD